MIKERPVSVWPFELDKLENWAYNEEIFSKEECDKIIEIGKTSLEKAKIFGENKEGVDVNKIRDSYTSWLFPSSDLDFYYRRLTDVITEINKKFFNFELYGFVEGLQFTYYKSPGGFYGRHVDKGSNGLIRKLSFVVQLNDPSEYEGGELLIYSESTPDRMKRKRGFLTAFPSFSLHEVSPVTKGERYSLVGWITGPAFK